MTRTGTKLAVLAVAVVAVLGIAGWLLWPSQPAAAALHGATATYTVDATIDPPRLGNATITIDLTTRDNAAPPANISVEAVMPLMGFATPALPGTGSGHYAIANVPLMMTGPWELHVSIGPDELTLPFTVSG
ncbi:MAG TPA: hypothetical protein VJ914_00415 [Pseudonocardiaceae bacterium]|nr:hypothetical protein [Pseudonocardiaceae bacterium]